MILKVMTEDGYSIYPGVQRVNFYSAAKANARYWAVSKSAKEPGADLIYVRSGKDDELLHAHPNFCEVMIPEEGKRSVCMLFGEYDIGGRFELVSWAFDEAFLMDDAGRTIEHLF